MENKLLVRYINGKFRGSRDLFGNKPVAAEGEYLKLFDTAVQTTYPEIDAWVLSNGKDISKEFLERLALRTQVTVKKSKPNWQHGRILYTKLTSYISNLNREEAQLPLVVLETGTARGFSSICLAKAMDDSSRSGMVFSVDTLPHDYHMYWNCISDSMGKITRQRLLASWPEETSRISFLTGKSEKVLKKLHIPRIHFAFLDAQHTKTAVLNEFDYVSSRQLAGDVIVFDDVTPGVFDGVTEAVNEIQDEGFYEVEFLGNASRGYAIATKL